VTSASLRERDIERAWLRHEPLRARVTPEARRAVSAFKRQIDGDADRLKDALRVHVPMLCDWTKLGPRNRERKFPRIKEALSPAEVVCIDGVLLVLWLQSFGPLLANDDPSYRQDCVLVLGMVAQRLRGSLRWNGFPILEAPDQHVAPNVPTVSRHLCRRSALPGRAQLPLCGPRDDRGPAARDAVRADRPRAHGRFTDKSTESGQDDGPPNRAGVDVAFREHGRPRPGGRRGGG
jgi:hypothetical protein